MRSREGSEAAAANVAAMDRKLGDPQRDVDEEIGHIRGLVLIRKMLAERGASAAELSECDEIIAGRRRQLADLAIRAAA